MEKMDLSKNTETLCRACANTCVRKFSINSKIYNFSKTIKDMIVLLVPQMETELDDENDVICNNCRKTLIGCVRFIHKFLRVEADRKDNVLYQKSPLDIAPRTILEVRRGCKIKIRLSTACHQNLQNIPSNVTEMEEDNLSDVDQNVTNSSCINGDFENDEKTDQVVNINIENYHCITNIRNNFDKKLIPSDNIFISAQQICTGKLNEFIHNLSSNDVSTIQFSQDSGSTEEKKRVILIGSTLKCKKCGKYFGSKENYARHLEGHTRIEQRQENWEWLRKLKIQKLEEKKAQRPRTRNNSPEERGPQKKPVDLECKTCSEKFSSTEDLELHSKIHPQFVCEKCGKGFAKISHINSHRSVHNDQNSYICEICGKAFKTRKLLRQHRFIHENNVHACKKCPKVFRGVLRLKRHMGISHREVQTRIWTCKECGKIFKKSFLYQTHYRQIHLRDGNKKCDVCGQGFHRIDYLRRHKRRHIIFGETRESFNNDATIFQTDKSVSNGTENDIKKRYVRNRSGRLGFKSRTGHSLQGPLQCQICMKHYKGLDNLKLHIPSHGKARFNCKYCRRTFKIKYQLTKHEKLHHKPDSSVKYRCEICWKRFEVQEDLDQHYFIHTNFKHKCELCDESFAREHALNDHIASVHEEDDDAEEELRILMKKGLGTTLYNSINFK